MIWICRCASWSLWQSFQIFVVLADFDLSLKLSCYRWGFPNRHHICMLLQSCPGLVLAWFCSFFWSHLVILSSQNNSWHSFDFLDWSDAFHIWVSLSADPQTQPILAQEYCSASPARCLWSPPSWFVLGATPHTGCLLPPFWPDL